MTRNTFNLDRRNGKFMGVCAGLAEYSGIDVTIIRVAAVVLTLLGGFPWTLVAYGGAAWIAKPKAIPDYEGAEVATIRGSTHDIKTTMRDIDRRMAEVETYVTSGNTRLAREIEELR